VESPGGGGEVDAMESKRKQSRRQAPGGQRGWAELVELVELVDSGRGLPSPLQLGWDGIPCENTVWSRAKCGIRMLHSVSAPLGRRAQFDADETLLWR
jgi:hypothetical protein